MVISGDAVWGKWLEKQGRGVLADACPLVAADGAQKRERNHKVVAAALALTWQCHGWLPCNTVTNCQ